MPWLVSYTMVTIETDNFFGLNVQDVTKVRMSWPRSSKQRGGVGCGECSGVEDSVGACPFAAAKGYELARSILGRHGSLGQASAPTLLCPFSRSLR